MLLLVGISQLAPTSSFYSTVLTLKSRALRKMLVSYYLVQRRGHEANMHESENNIMKL